MIFNRPRRREKKGYTYRFNDLTYASAQSAIYNVKFRSGESKANFIAITISTRKNKITEIVYTYEAGTIITVYLGNLGGWTKEAYRTVTFEKEPTGELLTFLQANATPQ